MLAVDKAAGDAIDSPRERKAVVVARGKLCMATARLADSGGA